MPDPAIRAPSGADRPSVRFADLHVHTATSDGRASVRETLVAAERLGWLDVVAITDHDTVRGALEAARIAADDGMRIGVVAGEEITTRSGHVLGLFLTERVEPGLSVAAAVRAIHDQGGLAVPAHPLFPYRACVSEREIRELAEGSATRPDALEAHNPTALGRLVRRRILRLAAAVGIAVVGGSDSHRPERIARSWTRFPGREGARAVEAPGAQAIGAERRRAEALRSAILDRTTSSGGTDDALVLGIPLFASQVAHGVAARLSGRGRRR